MDAHAIIVGIILIILSFICGVKFGVHMMKDWEVIARGLLRDNDELLKLNKNIMESIVKSQSTTANGEKGE